MCGRVRLSFDVSEIKLVFSIPPHRPIPNFRPSWNVAPTDQLPVVRHDRKAGERSLDLLRWGLVPYWAKDLNVGFANINAKAEGIETRPAFRDAFQRRRCLVPVDSFYEWKKTGTGKQPYAIALADGSLMALAACGRTGAGRRASGCEASRSSPPRRTNYALNFTTACRWSSSPKHGGFGSEKSTPMHPR
jgi:putative SOS response-associated peptidase YedK